MCLINDQILKRMFQLRYAAPVKCAFYHARLIYEIFSTFRTLAPFSLSCDSLCIWIQKNIFFIKKLSLRLIIRSVKLIGILKLFDFQSKYQNGICVTDLVIIRNTDFCIWFRRHRTEQKKCTTRCSVRTYGKTDTFRRLVRTIHSEKAGSDIKSSDMVKRIQTFSEVLAGSRHHILRLRFCGLVICKK